MKYFFLVFFSFIFLNVYCQQHNDIGKAIFESFKNEDTSCFRYFSTAKAYKKVWFGDSIGLRDKSKNSIALLTKSFQLDKSINTEVKFWMDFAKKMKEGEQKLWIETLRYYKKCDCYNLSNEGFEIVKELEDGLLIKYLLIIKAKEKFAIRFSGVFDNGIFYLGTIDYGIFWQNEDYEYKCTVKCKDGKEDFRSCDL